MVLFAFLFSFVVSGVCFVVVVLSCVFCLFVCFSFFWFVVVVVLLLLSLFCCYVIFVGLCYCCSCWEGGWRMCLILFCFGRLFPFDYSTERSHKLCRIITLYKAV